MATPPFGPVLEAALKETHQGGRLWVTKGTIRHPKAFCCVSGTTVGVAKAPVAVPSASVHVVCTGDPVTLDYSRSWSPSSTINSWSVNWGDGNISNGAWPGAGSVAHPLGGYVLPGEYQITLTVTDLLGVFDSTSVFVTAIDCTALEIMMLGGCASSGPHWSASGGIQWFNIGDDLLENSRIYDLKVNPFTLSSNFIEIWLATEDGVHRGEYDVSSGSITWAGIALPIPSEALAIPVVVALCPSRYDPLEIFALAHDNANDMVWIFRSVDGGVNWSYLFIGARGWRDLNGGVNSEVFTLCTGPINYMYAGGWCWWPTGVWPFNRWGKWNGTAWSAVGDGVEDIVNAQCKDDFNNVYCAGAFDDGATHYVAKYNGLAVSYLPVSPITDEILALAWEQGNRHIWAGGYSVGATNVLYYYDEATSTWIWPGSPNQFTGNFGGATAIHGIVVDGNGPDVYVTGNFTNIGALVCNGVAHWDGSSWNAMGTGLNQRGRAITMDDEGNVYVSGDCTFTIGGGPTYSKVGVWDGVSWEPVGTATSRITHRSHALAMSPDGVLYEGGETPDYIHFWNEITSTWDTPDADVPDDFVRAIAWDVTGDLWIGGDFININGLAANYVAEYAVVGGTLPTVGQTNLIDMSADGWYIYVTMLDTAGFPIALRIMYDLSEQSVIYQPGAGTWMGIRCDPYYGGYVWLFGNMGAVKVAVSGDYGVTLVDVTDGSWGGSELVRPLLISVWDGADVVAILNDALDAWRTIDTGGTWAKMGNTGWSAQSGARDPWWPDNIWIGRDAAGVSHIWYSPNLGAQWIEHSNGFTANAPVSALEVIG